MLKELLRALGGIQSRMRQAAAWLTEKVGEAKLKLDDPGGGELSSGWSVARAAFGT